jgi:hypothetical protein
VFSTREFTALELEYLMDIRTPLLVAALVVGCSSNASNKKNNDADLGTTVPDAQHSDTDASNQDANTTTSLPDRCTDGTIWTPGTQAFTNKTGPSGLEAADAEGVRINAGDINGDGYPDLAIRKAGLHADDFGSGERAVWLLLNKGDGTFTDITKDSGVVASRFSGDPNLGRPAEVWAFADVDNDDDLDVFTGFTQDGSNPDGAELMLNDGEGNFELGPLPVAFARRSEATSIGGATWTDVDRDGRVDLWLGQGAINRQPIADRLFRQTGSLEFEDVTASSGVETLPWTNEALNAGEAHTNAWSSAACDLNDDGTPDLLASSYGRSPNKLWLSDGDGWINNSVASGYAFDQRTDWTDNESARCWCTLHPDDEDCEGVPEPEAIPCETDADAFRWNHSSDREPWRLGGNSGTTVCADVDNDGDLDLLTTEIVHWDVGSSADPSELLFNDGSGTFERPGNEATGLTREDTSRTWDHGDITGAIFDFDNDGRPDVYIGSTDYPGTRGWLFHQKPDGTFEPVPLDEGIDHTRSHGIAVADYDRDGDLDVVVGHSKFRCAEDCYESGHARLWDNTIGQDGNWIQLKLVGGEGTNRAAIGARITVAAGGVTQTHEIGGGHGHYGIQDDLTQHFGLGTACEAEVTVRWPNADLTTQTFTVQTGYRYKVVQGEQPEPLNLGETTE